MPLILDGKAIAAQIREQVQADIARLKADTDITPGLGVLLVGEDPASQTYVRSKERACEELGIHSLSRRVPANTPQEDLLGIVEDFNRRPEVHGILVQLPLPTHVNTTRVLETVLPDKDVDGFHPVSLGRLLSGTHTVAPCTPSGIIEMLKLAGIEIAGKRAVVVGRSIIVGKPAALLLLEQQATVTVCHSRTRNLPEVTRQADILVAAMGKPFFIGPEHVREGAVVIDVGVNRVDRGFFTDDLLAQDPRYDKDLVSKGYTLVGDVHFPAVAPLTSAITPVPGGVGPLTIAMLMKNTVALAAKAAGR